MKHMNTRSLFRTSMLLAAACTLGTLAMTAAPPSAYAQNIEARTDKGYVLTGYQSVASVSVGTAGSGYTSAPTVAFTGGGGGVQATGTAKLKVVGSVTVVDGGSGYTTGDTIKVTGAATTPMVLTVTASSGAVASVAITTAGVYSTPITTSGAATTTLTGSGSGATLTLSWGVASVTVTSGGSGYSSAPTVAFSGGGGSSAAATATLASVAATTANFCRILPLADCVVEEITLVTKIGGKTYSAETLVGKTLKASVPYDVYGSAIKLSSGTAILFLR